MLNSSTVHRLEKRDGNSLPPTGPNLVKYINFTLFCIVLQQIFGTVKNLARKTGKI